MFRNPHQIDLINEAVEKSESFDDLKKEIFNLRNNSAFRNTAHVVMTDEDEVEMLFGLNHMVINDMKTGHEIMRIEKSTEYEK